MNFHLFVFISTFVFYVIMKMYKISVERQMKSKRKKSNLVYILFVPALLYLCYFMYIDTNASKKMSQILRNGGDSDDLLSIPYPDSNNSI